MAWYTFLRVTNCGNITWYWYMAKGVKRYIYNIYSGRCTATVGIRTAETAIPESYLFFFFSWPHADCPRGHWPYSLLHNFQAEHAPSRCRLRRLKVRWVAWLKRETHEPQTIWFIVTTVVKGRFWRRTLVRSIVWSHWLRPHVCSQWEPECVVHDTSPLESRFCGWYAPVLLVCIMLKFHPARTILRPVSLHFIVQWIFLSGYISFSRLLIPGQCPKWVWTTKKGTTTSAFLLPLETCWESRVGTALDGYLLISLFIILIIDTAIAHCPIPDPSYGDAGSNPIIHICIQLFTL